MGLGAATRASRDFVERVNVILVMKDELDVNNPEKSENRLCWVTDCLAGKTMVTVLCHWGERKGTYCDTAVKKIGKSIGKQLCRILDLWLSLSDLVLS